MTFLDAKETQIRCSATILVGDFFSCFMTLSFFSTFYDYSFQHEKTCRAFINGPAWNKMLQAVIAFKKSRWSCVMEQKSHLVMKISFGRGVSLNRVFSIVKENSLLLSFILSQSFHKTTHSFIQIFLVFI